MAVLINESTRVICRGFTGSQGTFPSEQAIAAANPSDAAQKIITADKA